MAFLLWSSISYPSPFQYILSDIGRFCIIIRNRMIVNFSLCLPMHRCIITSASVPGGVRYARIASV